MTDKPHIAVLKGGWSPERAVSLVSGEACAAALKTLGYRVSEIDVARTLPAQLAAIMPDICFNALHGVGGEDGEVQGILEVMQIPYTHSGVLASALAMDKICAKHIFSQAGLPVAEHIKLTREDNIVAHPLPPPYVVKPVNQGSSVNITIVPEGWNKVPDCITQKNWGFENTAAMAERYVAGRELTCAVIKYEACDVLEIKPHKRFYDYHAKYSEGGAVYEFPTDLDGDLIKRIRDITLKAHNALGCKGVSRADFRYDADRGDLVLLEVNTQPGMTPISLVPEIAMHRGMDFAALVEWIVEDASCQR